MHEHSRRTTRSASAGLALGRTSLNFRVLRAHLVFENVMYHEFNLEKVQKRLLILHATQHPDAVPYVTLYSGDSSTSQPYFEFNGGSISTWKKASFITIKELL